jgi:hypothetical protein
MAMKMRRLAIGFLAVLACSRSTEDAGIVLNVDTEVTADRTTVNIVIVTVDSRRQEWILTTPLPGSLGIVTSPGNKSVTVEGFANASLRGKWSGVVVASQGTVVVKDVHLLHIEPGVVDAGAGSVDGGTKDGVHSDSVDAAMDGSARDAVGIDLGGTGGISGKGGNQGYLDGGVGGIPGSGGMIGKDAGNSEVPRSDGPLSGPDGPLSGPDGPLSGPDGPLSGPDGPLSGPDGPLSGSDGVLGITAPLTGAFSVASDFQVHATAATPGALGGTLQLMHGLVEDPGTAILDFAEDAGVSELSTLRSVLPDALESKLTGWMNSYIKTAAANGVSPYDRLVWLDNTIQALLLTWVLQSRLELPLATLGTHTPVSLIFTSPAGPMSYPIDATALVTPGVGVSATVSWPGGPDGAAVATISDHFMGFPFGRYALPALDAILLAEYGVPTVGAYLSDAIGCSGMADSVGSRCVSILCVGHEDELLAICEGGLSEAEKQIEAQILGIDYKAIRFQNGTATAVGVSISRPQDATSMQNGVWNTSVDFGNGPEPATATFSALAEGGSP